MLQAIQPVWLLLILSGLLLFVGCSIIYVLRPTPVVQTPAASVTRTPFASATGTFMLPLSEATAALTSVARLEPEIARSVPPDTNDPPPECYIQAGGGYICMGQIENPTDRDWRGGEVRINLYDAQSYLIATQLVVPAPATIRANSKATYHALFPPTPREPATAQAIPQGWEYTAASESTLTRLEERGVYTANGRYILTARIVNPGDQAVHAVRGIVTLLDANDVVIGYRIIPISERLNAGASATLRAEIIPMRQSDVIQHHLIIEHR